MTSASLIEELRAALAAAAAELQHHPFGVPAALTPPTDALVAAPAAVRRIARTRRMCAQLFLYIYLLVDNDDQKIATLL
jgi:hypothetical protein